MSEKPEIIIPFDRIGEEGWDGPTDAILQDIADIWRDTRPTPYSAEALLAAEQRLGVTLPPALKLFYARFGAADVGEDLQDPVDMNFLQRWAKGFDRHDALPPDQTAVLPRLVTFSEAMGNGDAFCFHADDHSVWHFDQETAPALTRFFDSVDDYFKGCLIKAQQDLLEEPEAEELVEELLVELFGEALVVKWLY